MGNNPVMYVDPDGEFVMLFAIAGFTIGMMGTAVYADNNDINMSGHDLLMAGGRWGALAAGGAGIVKAGLATAAAGAAQGTAAANAATAGKLLKAGLKGGTINTLSNYNFENGFKDIGFGTFLDFSAGFLGAASGVQAGSKWVGMGIGGALNMGFNADQGDGIYEYSQGFAGGALSSYAGMGKYVEGDKLFSNANWKNVETFLKYGIQSTAYDFAHTEKKYFWGEDGKGGREWYEHVGMFAVGGFAGVGIGEFFTGSKYEFGSVARVGFGAGIYAVEWTVSSRIKYGAYARYNGYDPGGFYTGSSQIAKGWISGFKWALPSYNFLIGQ